MIRTAPDLSPRDAPPPYVKTVQTELSKPSIAGELFLSPEHAKWRKDRLRLDRKLKPAARSQASGVRFQAWDPTGKHPEKEQQCQKDVGRLVRSVAKMRGGSLDHIVLSRDAVRGHSLGEKEVSRVKFGLNMSSGKRYQDETKATKECHRQIVKAAKRCGFIVEHPKSFDPKTKFTGLATWADELKLRRRRRPKPWWLLPLLLLALLPFIECQSPQEFFGFKVDESFIVIVDVSPSVQKDFPAIQAEVKKTLAAIRGSGATCFANIITFSSFAESALGGIKEVDDQVADQLNAFADQMTQRGGTRLESAITLAAAEIQAHGRDTTLIILTDGQDQSVTGMLGQIDSIKSSFGEPKVKAFALTPRLFDGTAPPIPQGSHEEQLSEFACALNGRFGPQEEDS